MPMKKDWGVFDTESRKFIRKRGGDARKFYRFATELDAIIMCAFMIGTRGQVARAYIAKKFKK